MVTSSATAKLTAYEYKSAKVDFATGEVEYDCILGGVPTTFKTTDIIKVYKDEDAYKRDQVFNDYTYSWGEFVRSTIGYTPYELDDDEDCAKAYCVKNGEIVETAFPTIFIMEKGKQSRYVGDRVYTSRDEAMLYCDIIKVEADGTETRCSSPASLVMLNEEQMVAFKAVEEALKKRGNSVSSSLVTPSTKVSTHTPTSISRDITMSTMRMISSLSSGIALMVL